ncbi:MAG TPA: hypothetical protein VMW66_04640 [Elusimicrobiales bacterium]|nr:hypothetical protein [Elusimicrobiales bacterium]
MQAVATKKRKNRKIKSAVKNVIGSVSKKTLAKKKIVPKVTAVKNETVKTQAPKHYIIVDHPHNGEVITTDYYTFRLGASPCDRVEIRLNGKEWQSCRNSIGYWWFDWFNFAPGTYKLKARAINATNNTKISKEIKFKVKHNK